jgi:hypothetical protein
LDLRSRSRPDLNIWIAADPYAKLENAGLARDLESPG